MSYYPVLELLRQKLLCFVFCMLTYQQQYPGRTLKYSIYFQVQQKISEKRTGKQSKLAYPTFTLDGHTNPMLCLKAQKPIFTSKCKASNSLDQNKYTCKIISNTIKCETNEDWFPAD